MLTLCELAPRILRSGTAALYTSICRDHRQKALNTNPHCAVPSAEAGQCLSCPLSIVDHKKSCPGGMLAVAAVWVATINLSCGSLRCRDIEFFACPLAAYQNVCVEMIASRPIRFPTLRLPHIPLPVRPLVLPRASERTLS